MLRPTLYTCDASGNAYKAVLLAALLNRSDAMDIVELDWFAGEHRRPPFTDLSPRAAIPILTLRDPKAPPDAKPETVIADSAAILVYLAGTLAPPDTWWPADPLGQAQVTDWLAFAATWIADGPSTARAMLNFGIDAARLDVAQAKSVRALEVLEKRLADRKWLVGERPTVADCAVFPYVALAPMGGISLERFAAVRRWIADVRALPGFVPIEGLDDPNYRQKGKSA